MTGTLNVEGDIMQEKEIIVRLSKIEGQVRGLKSMIESQRSCSDIIIQISAIQSALKKTTQLILKKDALKCLENFDKNKDEKSIEMFIATITNYMDIKSDETKVDEID